MPMCDGDTIRREFNKQHGQDFASPHWVRLDLPTGPVLARRRVRHQSAAIYIMVVSGFDRQRIARHYLVTTKRELKSNGTAKVSVFDDHAWNQQIGYTEQEYTAAKRSTARTSFTVTNIAKYEGTVTADNRS